MKQIGAIIVLLIISISQVNAQNDSLAYETQRKKINQLLDERSNRFGQYEGSLGKRSGIFGLKTKKDMQFSNDILRQIVLTDNDIFSELKILLDYKDLEKEQVETRAETVEGRIDRFQLTITRLQQENEKLRTQSEKNIADYDRLTNYLILLIISLIASIWYIYKLKKLPKIDMSSTKSA
ncbi:MAG: hypothetical protein Q8S11_07895 [Daejeonella sp.]|uniref:hypothetical protein n=1 Tax=Daejeonella sp. TaxID=2805397 RepID=UPI002735CCC7|nr:hypothetical protein [Daejeonella sp.]MDP3468243.1 hypothetical protein [Daejeonella sp.]